MRQHDEASSSVQKLRRQVKTIGEIPDYVTRQILQRLTTKDEAVFKTFRGEDCTMLICWALGAPDLPLPRREMELPALFVWAAERHRARQEPLLTVDVAQNADFVDWEWTATSFK